GNRLVYPGARITASASAGGSVSPASAVTDADGQAAFGWSPGAGAANQLRLSLEAIPSVSLTLRAGSAVPAIADVVNAASGASGIAAPALETVFGTNLAGAGVSLNGAALPILYVSDSQINFYVPAGT